MKPGVYCQPKSQNKLERKHLSIFYRKNNKTERINKAEFKCWIHQQSLLLLKDYLCLRFMLIKVHNQHDDNFQKKKENIFKIQKNMGYLQQ